MANLFWNIPEGFNPVDAGLDRMATFIERTAEQSLIDRIVSGLSLNPNEYALSACNAWIAKELRPKHGEFVMATDEKVHGLAMHYYQDVVDGLVAEHKATADKKAKDKEEFDKKMAAHKANSKSDMNSTNPPASSTATSSDVKPAASSVAKAKEKPKRNINDHQLDIFSMFQSCGLMATEEDEYDPVEKKVEKPVEQKVEEPVAANADTADSSPVEVSDDGGVVDTPIIETATEAENDGLPWEGDTSSIAMPAVAPVVVSDEHEDTVAAPKVVADDDDFEAELEEQTSSWFKKAMASDFHMEWKDGEF